MTSRTIDRKQACDSQLRVCVARQPDNTNKRIAEHLPRYSGLVSNDIQFSYPCKDTRSADHHSLVEGLAQAAKQKVYPQLADAG